MSTMNTMYDFSGRTLLMSGASGGIGREVARLFVASGANVVLTDRDAEPLSEIAVELGAGERIATLPGNAADPKDAEAAVELAKERFGGVDILIPSAGIYPVEPFETMTDEAWHRTISINLDGVFYLTRRAISVMKQGASIVNMTSLAAYRGAASNAHYGASKGAIVSFTKSLARELAPKIRVNAVAPGIIETPMTEQYLRTRGDETLRQTPLQRFGKPSEVACVAAFLASEAASFVTGEIIHVNGGLYMG